MTWWELLLLFPLLVGVLAGVAGSVLPLLPGPPLILLCAVGYAWATGFRYLGAATIVTLTVVVILSLVIDQAAGAAGASRAGASKHTVVVAFLLGSIGLLVGPLWLVFVLPLLGVIAVELAVGRGIGRALKSAGGFGIGNLANAVIKLILSLVMATIIVVGFLR